MPGKWDKYAAAEDKYSKYAVSAEAPAKAAPKDDLKETATDFAVGAGSGASFDFDDEIVGGLKAIGEFGLNLGGGQGLDKARAKARAEYVKSRDEYRGRKRLAGERSPVANTLGQVTGAVASSLATGGAGAAAGAGRAGLQGALRAGGRLAAEGAIQGVGASEATDARGLATDAATGGAVSLAAGGALRGAGKLAKGLIPSASGLEARAASNRLRQGGLSPSKVRKAPGGIEGQVAGQKELGIGGGLAGKETILGQAEDVAQREGADRVKIGQQLAGKGVMVDGRAVALRLRQQAAQISPGPAGADKRAAYLQFANEYEAMGKKPLSVFDQDRAELAGKAFATDSPKNLVKQDVHRALNDVIEDVANQADKGAGSKFRKAGQNMAVAIRAKKGAQAGLDRESGAEGRFGAVMGGIEGARQGGVKGAVLGAAGGFLAPRALRSPAFRAGAQELGAKALRRLSPIGRAIEKARRPAGSLIGRYAAQQGATRVAEAAEQSPEEGAQTHFIESLSNPEYRQESLGE